MARKFLTALDLAKNELQNAAVQSLGSAPSSPVKFQLYGNTSDNTVYWWDGTQWVAAKDAGTISFGSVPAETTFGLARADGVASTAARSDHTHGSPTHVNADHAAINLSALAAPTADVSMGNFKITSLAAPVGATDATNKSYVDNLVAGLTWKAPVRFATPTGGGTAAMPPTGLLANWDGFTPNAGDRILVKDNNGSGATAPSTNGIWIASAGVWTRAPDADSSAELVNAAVYVSEGNTLADTAWVCTTNAPITVGTTALTFVQFAGGGSVTAGAGLTQSGNTLNVIGDATMVVTADQISQAPLTGDVTTPSGSNAATIAAGVVTNAKLANMPFITIKGNNTGSAGPPVDMTPAQLITMLDANLTRRYSVACAAATSTVANHAFGTQAVMVQVYRNSVPYDVVECDIEHTDMANVTVRFATAPAAGAFQIMVIG